MSQLLITNLSLSLYMYALLVLFLWITLTNITLYLQDLAQSTCSINISSINKPGAPAHRALASRYPLFSLSHHTCPAGLPGFLACAPGSCLLSFAGGQAWPLPRTSADILLTLHQLPSLKAWLVLPGHPITELSLILSIPREPTSLFL